MTKKPFVIPLILVLSQQRLEDFFYYYFFRKSLKYLKSMEISLLYLYNLNKQASFYIFTNI